MVINLMGNGSLYLIYSLTSNKPLMYWWKFVILQHQFIADKTNLKAMHITKMYMHVFCVFELKQPEVLQ